MIHLFGLSGLSGPVAWSGLSAAVWSWFGKQPVVAPLLSTKRPRSPIASLPAPTSPSSGTSS